MIVGEGSASFEMLRHLVHRLPVMIAPRWLDTRTQPIAIGDVVRALADLAERADAPAEVQLGGADALTYREMIRRTAPSWAGAAPIVIRVPLLTPRLSSYWVALVTPVEVGLVRPLVDGLKEEMLVRDAAAAPGSTTRPLGLRRRRPGGAAREAAQPPRRAPRRRRGDPRPRGAHGVRRAAARSARSRPPTSTMPAAELDAIWSPMHLERLARTYWKYLSRVHARADPRRLHADRARGRAASRGRSCCCASTRPSTRWTPSAAIVRWRIRDGLLVARRAASGDGYLEIDVRRCPSDAPGHARGCTSRSRSPSSTPRSRSGSRAGSTPTRSRASTCSSRTASCARSPGSSSRSRRSAASRRAEDGDGAPPRAGPVNVGDTPWPVVGALAARRRRSRSRCVSRRRSR